MRWLVNLVGTAVSIAVLLLLAGKMELRRRWAVPAAIIIPAVCLLAASRLIVLIPSLTPFLQVLLAFLASLAVSGILILIMFFRDPRRIPPDRPRSVVSPADGRIIYVNALLDDRLPVAVKKGRRVPLAEFIGETLPRGGGVQIGIMMSYLDVHVNRAPIAGQVERVRRITGGFRSLKHQESLLTNERVFTVIRSSSARIGVVQIASRVVRRIVPFIKEGVSVCQGERIGVIRFGSQVDLFLLDRNDWSIQVNVGDYVKAGFTVLAAYGEIAASKVGE